MGPLLLRCSRCAILFCLVRARLQPRAWRSVACAGPMPEYRRVLCGEEGRAAWSLLHARSRAKGKGLTEQCHVADDRTH